jgi:hypothetical protein
VNVVKIAVLDNTVKKWKMVVLLRQTQPFALIAPRVGRPNQRVPNVNHAKPVTLVLLLVKIVPRVVLANTDQVKMFMVILRIRLFVLVAPWDGHPKQAAQNANHATVVHLMTSVVKSVKNAHLVPSQKVVLYNVSLAS